MVDLIAINEGLRAKIKALERKTRELEQKNNYLLDCLIQGVKSGVIKEIK